MEESEKKIQGSDINGGLESETFLATDTPIDDGK